MIKILTYKRTHQIGIDEMLREIAAEFSEAIYSKPTSSAPVVPDNYWVASSNNTVIGTVGLITVSNYAILKKMMLRKAYRGKEFGISKLLLDTAINWCKQNNISKLYLGTMLQFKAAQFFYKKNGFKEISESELPNDFLGNPVDKVFFVKEID